MSAHSSVYMRKMTTPLEQSVKIQRCCSWIFSWICITSDLTHLQICSSQNCYLLFPFMSSVQEKSLILSVQPCHNVGLGATTGFHTAKQPQVKSFLRWLCNFSMWNVTGVVKICNKKILHTPLHFPCKNPWPHSSLHRHIKELTFLNVAPKQIVLKHQT